MAPDADSSKAADKGKAIETPDDVKKDKDGKTVVNGKDEDKINCAFAPRPHVLSTGACLTDQINQPLRS